MGCEWGEQSASYTTKDLSRRNLLAEKKVGVGYAHERLGAGSAAPWQMRDGIGGINGVPMAGSKRPQDVLLPSRTAAQTCCSALRSENLQPSEEEQRSERPLQASNFEVS